MNKLKLLLLKSLERILIAAIAAGISGYWSYRATKAEAEAGYKTLVSAVDKLQDEAEEHIRNDADNRAKVDVLAETLKEHGRIIAETRTQVEIIKIALNTRHPDTSTMLRGLPALAEHAKPRTAPPAPGTTPEAHGLGGSGPTPALDRASSSAPQTQHRRPLRLPRDLSTAKQQFDSLRE